MDVNKVSKAITNKLIELDINQEELAEKLGVKQGLLSQYKNGSRNPKVDFYNKWKEIFREDINDIIITTKITIDELFSRSIEQQATLTVLEGMIISLAHQQSGRSIVSIIGELKKEKADEVSRILHELSRKKE